MFSGVSTAISASIIVNAMACVIFKNILISYVKKVVLVCANSLGKFLVESINWLGHRAHGSQSIEQPTKK
jgi:hypothetical protein